MCKHSRVATTCFVLLLSVLVVFGAVACSDDSHSSDSSTESGGDTTATTVESTEESTESVTESATETESESITESATEHVTEIETESDSESETFTETETVTETETETETVTETETETETETFPPFNDKAMEAVVIAQNANVYSTPTLDPVYVHATVNESDRLAVTGENMECYRIDLDGIDGYMSKTVLADAAVLDTFTEVHDKVIIAGAANVKVRTYPSADSELTVRGVVPEGTVLTRTGVGEKWSRIEYTINEGVSTEAVKEYYINNTYLTVYETKPDGTLPFVPDQPERITSDWKAIWLSQFDLQNVYTNGAGSQREESSFRKLMTKILDNVVKDGFNTVILQLRPYADSMYPSDVYPPSRYAVGNYAKDFMYDPIAIVMELCTERDLSVHAWINPMRGMTEAEIQQVDDKYLIKQWYNDPSKKGSYITFYNKNWYLNPAYPEVRKLICDGAAEILERYEMDGVHMDDYFYPTTEATFDYKAYAAYRKDGGTEELLDWRRSNLDALISELYATVKTHDLRALFGISPAGNINTVYGSHCADVYNWCANPGYIDYIMPQVYFGFEHASWDFKKTCNLWLDAIKTEYVDLIIGVTFGKALSGVDNYAGTGKNEWSQHKDIMKRSLEYSATLDKCVGMTVFCYQYLYDPATGITIAGTVQEHKAFVERLHTITWFEEETAE